MKDKWLEELFDAANNGHFEALGKAVFEIDDSIDILKLARFMAARNGYEDTHAILDNWINELEGEEETPRDLDLDELYAWLDSCQDDNTDLGDFWNVMAGVSDQDLIDMLKSQGYLDGNEAKCMYAQERYSKWLEEYEESTDE